MSNRWSLASWITLTPTEQLLQPNQTVGINVIIEVPEDALPGGHYAMITHQPVSTGGLTSANTYDAVSVFNNFYLCE